tara:strand:+ start:66 stop:470 length:405 start_codon:yes stop_codon:yes gene_type:complete
MKDKEIEIIKQLNKRFNSSLTLSSNEFSYYDAFNKKIILEIKIRNKVYKTKLIQVDKFYSLLMIAEAQNKIPFYLVKDDEGVYLYNLKKLKDQLLNSKIKSIKSPYQTEFLKNKIITKYFYELKKSQIHNFYIL